MDSPTVELAWFVKWILGLALSGDYLLSLAGVQSEPAGFRVDGARAGVYPESANRDLRWPWRLRTPLGGFLATGDILTAPEGLV